MYHNAFYATSGSTGYVSLLNDAGWLPTQGVGDNQRVGDQIYTTGFQLKMLIGQKVDRPNVTFRYLVSPVPKILEQSIQCENLKFLCIHSFAIGF